MFKLFAIFFEMAAHSRFHYIITLLAYLLQLTAGTQFASHVSISTPTRSFTHGVGDPVTLLGRRHYNRPTTFRGPPPPGGPGYPPRMKPAVPFTREDRPRDITPWPHNTHINVAIPVLPPSPYKVDSPDPESLWPEGLFLPPLNPPSFANRRSDASGVATDTDPMDPYLLAGSEAVAAVTRANRHGLYYFHDIPHIASLLENQELRVHNNLKSHRLGSIRYTWPFYRE